MLLDLTLLLRRNRIKTTTTRIPFYGHYCQAIAVALTDLFIAGQQGLESTCSLASPASFAKMFFFFLVSSNDFFQLCFLVCQVRFLY